MTTGSAAGNIPRRPRRRAPARRRLDVDAAADGAVGGGSHVPPARARQAPARRSLLGQALHDTFGQHGARVGAVWIAIVAVLGVFAPFIANSHPILVRPKGGGLDVAAARRRSARSTSRSSSTSPTRVWLLVRRHLTAVRSRHGVLLWPVLTVTALVLAARVGPDLLTFCDLPAALARDRRRRRRGDVGWAWVILVNLRALLLAVAAGGAGGVQRSTSSAGRAAARSSCGGGRGGAAHGGRLVHRPPAGQRRLRALPRDGEGGAGGVGRPHDHPLQPQRPPPRPARRDRSSRPSRDHWLGTTEFGEDMLSRMLHACRVALAIGLIATGIATAIGIVVGGIMGYYGGWIGPARDAARRDRRGDPAAHPAADRDGLRSAAACT